MKIRKAEMRDIDRIMELCEEAKKLMRASGNMTQWVNGYPHRSYITSDVEGGHGYVWAEGSSSGAEDGRPGAAGTEVLHGYFAFLTGEAPSYDKLTTGQWLNDKPFGTMHRIASDGTRGGFFQEALEFCLMQCSNIRIDTHQTNQIMLHLFEKHGFQYCGIIEAEGIRPRVAYQLCAE